MPNLPHIILPRAEGEPPRRKHGFGRTPPRDFHQHGPELQRQLDEVLHTFQAARSPEGINPNLILKVQLNHDAVVEEKNWEAYGLTLLSVEQDKTLVLFSSDQQLREFHRRLQEYRGGPQAASRKSAPYAAIFASIDNIANVQPEDRIGRLLRVGGVVNADDLQLDQQYVVDIELWDFGTRVANLERVNQLGNFVRARGGDATDQYIGESLVLLRVRASGEVIRELLGVDSVAQLDLPPQPTLTVAERLRLGLPDFPPVPEPDAGAAPIAILDSGLTSAHPLLAPAVGEATAVPLALGDGADDHGHGTLVGGIALYGDIEACIDARRFVPNLRLYSARVLNEHCRFDERALITTQMRDAIRYLSETYGCRVFNLSLGDANLPYRGGKVSAWASILDSLARELNILIVVSAGNFAFHPGPDEPMDAHLQRYPRYLLDDAAKIIEPATGAIVLTVGSLSNSDRLPGGAGQRDVALRPISRQGGPSPFTRCGPGLGGGVKPELCDFGGNRAYDGRLAQVRDLNELSMVSMNREYLNRLFAAAVGTSYASPRIAHIAAKLYRAFPDASANLIRALLVSSASVPAVSADLLSPLEANAVLRVCGYGRPSFDRARYSDENRAVLYSESRIGFDNFHVYQIPIPESFSERREPRAIEVTLAYDPPVRHSRFDYLGAKMSFRLIRGKRLDEVVEAFQSQAGIEDPTDGLTSTRWECEMTPGPRTREGGTLQKAVFSMRRIPRPEWGNTYHLVIRCEGKWAGVEHAPQRYAVVVVLRQEGDVNIYHQIAQRIRAAARARVR
jgi:subtilisin family serine protease